MGPFESAGRPHFRIIRIMTEGAIFDLPMVRSLLVEIVGKIFIELTTL